MRYMRMMIRRAIPLTLFGLLAGFALTAAEDGVKAPPVPAKSVVSAQYQIGAGDLLQVIVWKEQEATVPGVVVRADGKIGLPFVKEVDVSGLTPAQAEGAITDRLKPFINEPDVTVIVREVHSKRIYMVGAVKHEGIIDLKYPMTVLQAIPSSSRTRSQPMHRHPPAFRASATETSTQIAVKASIRHGG